jgi:hypothetical protein
LRSELQRAPPLQDGGVLAVATSGGGGYYIWGRGCYKLAPAAATSGAASSGVVLPWSTVMHHGDGEVPVLHVAEVEEETPIQTL